ncbi:hypothetical protein BN2475_140060 [Paraburkholderia ribeironis]|uniref:Uncharacterized protein n=1 Tax=Paraburkholderia ribeironis TaxID=1247936 RepID=A0A1N7RSW4_9BURK|nr:hypothetical protein BN2475_140060 [Paraburkholderia ribeironis]
MISRSKCRPSNNPSTPFRLLIIAHQIIWAGYFSRVRMPICSRSLRSMLTWNAGSASCGMSARFATERLLDLRGIRIISDESLDTHQIANSLRSYPYHEYTLKGLATRCG